MAVAALALALLGGAPDARAAPKAVLVVGDSLEVGTGPYLRSELPGVRLTIDARKSRPSPEGVRALRERLRPADAVVVFDLGVNDDPSNPGLLAGDLRAARELAGDRCMVVATLSRPSLGGVSVGGLNAAIRRFVDETPGAELVDWREAALSQPDLLGADGVHPNGAGYAQRARLVAEGVQACLESGGARGRHQARGARARPRARFRRRPGRVDWVAVGRTPPWAALLAVGREAAGVLSAGWRGARDGLTPAPPEPVLGHD
ncbi:MAG: hypothetical protein ABR581_05435 [Thermoleophilaceae bacterium]